MKNAITVKNEKVIPDNGKKVFKEKIAQIRLPPDFINRRDALEVTYKPYLSHEKSFDKEEVVNNPRTQKVEFDFINNEVAVTNIVCVDCFENMKGVSTIFSRAEILMSVIIYDKAGSMVCAKAIRVKPHKHSLVFDYADNSEKVQTETFTFKILQ